MILLSKKENELNKEEKLKIEIMKVIAIAKGYEISENSKFDLDFRDGSSFEKTAKLLLFKFDISYKQKRKEINLEKKVIQKEKQIKTSVSLKK